MRNSRSEPSTSTPPEWAATEAEPALDGRRSPTRVLAVSSGGGHWLQLCRLAPAWQGQAVVTACTADGPAMPVRVMRHHRLPDATRWDRLGLLKLAARVGRLVLQERPDVIVTTGAAPGLFALAWGRLIGARTVWVDSLANVERLSGAGRCARWVAHEWLTQWPHLSRTGGPSHRGSLW